MITSAFFSFKKIIAFLFLGILLFACNSGGKQSSETTDSVFKANPVRLEHMDVKTLEIGSQAPDFNLPDVSGKFYSLNDFKDAEVLVVIFTCNHCPTAQAYEDRVIAFTRAYKSKGVSVVAIMPNSVYSLLAEECSYSDMDDTYDNMKIRAKYKGYNFPYLYDGDNEAVSIKYGPTATPHVFVFNKERKLFYTGRIDSSEKPGTGNAEDLKGAVDALLEGKTIENQVTKTFGCSIKWSWKTEWTDKVNKDWAEKEVTLEKIDKKGISDLIKNDTKNLRLINVWATWCGPCVIEFPDLVMLQRNYGARNFEFISISADKPEKEEQVVNFLKTKHAPVKNYIFNSDDKYALIEAIDPKWNGSLPYSILIEPGGKIVYSVQGSIELIELKRKIVENPLLGRYY